MTIEELHNNLHILLPFKEDKGKPFQKRLKICLDKYLGWVANLLLSGNPLDKETVEAVTFICNKIRDIVSNSMKGMPSTSFTQIHRLLNGYYGEQKKIDILATLLTVPPNIDFYRMRIMESIKDVDRSELFHIPITQRGIVKTQRYSSPGYPCLYLGKSIYGCWEEMRRPPMHQCAVTRLKNEGELYFIDLTIPSVEQLKTSSYLKLVPLVIACMIRVDEVNATFKPEYIVPQLLIEWILKNRKFKLGDEKKEIHGVAYLSTHLNQDFEFPMNTFINYAIPVFSVNPNNKYCYKLCNTFSLTSPTTNDLEKLKCGYGIDGGILGLSPEEEWQQNYNTSDFGNMEKRLKDETKFKLEKIKSKG